MNIVAIRPAAIGDSLIALPVLKALRQKYPHSHITFISNPAALPLAQIAGLADETMDSSPVWKDLLSPTGMRNTDVRRLLPGSDLTICWMRDEDGQIERNLLAAGARQVVIGPEGLPLFPSKHMVEYLAEPLALPNVAAGFVLTLPDDADNICALNPPIAMHPGSNDESRRWPPSAFADLITQLLRRGCPVLLIAGGAEEYLVKEIQKRISRRVNQDLFSLLVGAPILEVARRIKQSRCFIGNDSGITHLAGQLGVPTIALFGPSNPLNWRPLGPSVEVLQKFPLKRLPAQTVLKSVLQYI